MKATLIVGSGEFVRSLRSDVAGARERVFAQMLTFEADEAGRCLAEILRSCPAKDKRMIVDDYIRVMISDRFLYSPMNLLDRGLQQEARETRALLEDLQADSVQVRRTNPLGFMLSRLPQRNHKKLFLIDDRVAYVGGINVSDHNYAWHDLMLRIEDESIATFLREDFESTWEGDSRSGRRTFAGVEMLSLDGESNDLLFDRVFELMDAARDRIWIESPYLSFPFFEKLRNATSRGVRVDVVSPARNNKPLFDAYTRWEAQRSGIRLWHLPPPMTHMKAMLIDGKHLVIGSANFDYLSYRTQQELVAIVSLPSVVSEFTRRVAVPDMARSTAWRPTKRASQWSLPYALLRLLGTTWTGALRAVPG